MRISFLLMASTAALVSSSLNCRFSEPSTPGESAAPATPRRRFSERPSGMNDEALANDALAVVQRHAKSQGWKEQFQKLTITSTDWSMRRHPRTGMLLGRFITVAAYAVWPDGHCTSQQFALSQEHDGSGFVRSLRFDSVGAQDNVVCE
jgi:hypothetical protein